MRFERRAVYRDADQGEVSQSQPLVKAPTQEFAVGVEHHRLAALSERGRVLADLAEQQRLPAAESHHASGGDHDASTMSGRRSNGSFPGTGP